MCHELLALAGALNYILSHCLKVISFIYFTVSERNILTKFSQTVCYTFIIKYTTFEKMHVFSINMQ